MMLSRATYKSSNKRENGVLVDSENQEYRFNKCSGRKNYYICRKKAQFGCKATAMVETVDINKVLCRKITTMEQTCKLLKWRQL